MQSEGFARTTLNIASLSKKKTNIFDFFGLLSQILQWFQAVQRFAHGVWEHWFLPKPILVQFFFFIFFRHVNTQYRTLKVFYCTMLHYVLLCSCAPSSRLADHVAAEANSSHSFLSNAFEIHLYMRCTIWYIHMCGVHESRWINMYQFAKAQRFFTLVFCEIVSYNMYIYRIYMNIVHSICIISELVAHSSLHRIHAYTHHIW